MSSTPSPVDPTTTTTTTTTTNITNPSAQIRALCQIDSDIARLLRSAGLALKSLSSAPPPQTNDPSNTDDHNDEEEEEVETEPETAEKDPLARATATFAKHNTTYLHTVQSLQARLRRQAYALEEAGMIPSEADAAAATVATSTAGAGAAQGGRGGSGREATMAVTNGGLGAFDVGWLNSRGDGVGRRKEVELWREMRGLVEDLVEREEKERRDRELGDRGVVGGDDMDVREDGVGAAVDGRVDGHDEDEDQDSAEMDTRG